MVKAVTMRVRFWAGTARQSSAFGNAYRCQFRRWPCIQAKAPCSALAMASGISFSYTTNFWPRQTQQNGLNPSFPAVQGYSLTRRAKENIRREDLKVNTFFPFFKKNIFLPLPLAKKQRSTTLYIRLAMVTDSQNAECLKQAQLSFEPLLRCRVEDNNSALSR